MSIDTDSPYNGNLEAQEQERRYFQSVLLTFRSYRELSLLRIERNETCLNSLPERHRLCLDTYRQDLQNLKKCIESNANLIRLITRDSYNMFDNVSDEQILENPGDGASRTLSEGLDKVQSVFKQLMRDWSDLGRAERQQCYQPIIDEILEAYPEVSCDRSQIKVLVPGAGLGRLAFEIASKGFICQGNEFNLFMLITGFFVLNRCQKVNEYEVFPWVHQYVNNLSAQHQIAGFQFPDIQPTPTNGEFSMAAGDFLDIYKVNEDWDCIATCFFIDCASNIVAFVEIIFQILKPGGVWVNLGPLLYHYSDMKYEHSIEPSYAVLCEVIKNIGFVMEKSQTGVKTRYCQNPNSMLQYEYDSIFFVCKKPL